MSKFKLKVGGHTIGSGLTAQRFRKGDIFEAEGDLAAFDSNKFERVDDPKDYEGPRASSQMAAAAYKETTLHGEWEKSKAAPAKDLQAMSAKELESLAAEEEIDVKGAKSKEDLLKAIKPVKK